MVQNVVRIVEAGSKKQHLQVLALSIFETCLQQGIRLDMEWIPHSLNDKVDYISRIQDFDDWRVNPQVFALIDSMWGPQAVDCFAHISRVPNCLNFIAGFGARVLLLRMHS